MANASVADLLRAGRIETIQRDVAAAWSRIDEANAHLASSAALAKTDPALAYVALYDAARKAITAHMQANGCRPTNRSGRTRRLACMPRPPLPVVLTCPTFRLSTGCARFAIAASTTSSPSLSAYSLPISLTPKQLWRRWKQPFRPGHNNHDYDDLALGKQPTSTGK